jgi:hypothetical protein
LRGVAAVTLAFCGALSAIDFWRDHIGVCSHVDALGDRVFVTNWEFENGWRGCCGDVCILLSKIVLWVGIIRRSGR